MLSLREKHEYEQEIAQLKLGLTETKELLRKSRNSKNEWHCKYRAAAGITMTLTDRLRLIIIKSKADGFEGSITNECKRIGKVIGVSYRTAYNIWYEKSPNKPLVGAVDCNL